MEAYDKKLKQCKFLVKSSNKNVNIKDEFRFRACKSAKSSYAR